MTRVEAPEKVTGTATYAFEYPVPDAAGALAMPGVLAVLGGVTTGSFGTKNFELALFTGDQITYRGQLVGVVADTLENARVDVTYTTPAQHNNPMEPHAAIAEASPEPQPRSATPSTTRRAAGSVTCPSSRRSCCGPGNPVRT